MEDCTDAKFTTAVRRWRGAGRAGRAGLARVLVAMRVGAHGRIWVRGWAAGRAGWGQAWSGGARVLLCCHCGGVHHSRHGSWALRRRALTAGYSSIAQGAALPCTHAHALAHPLTTTWPHSPGPACLPARLAACLPAEPACPGAESDVL